MNVLTHPLFVKLAAHNALTVAEFCGAMAILVRANLSFDIRFEPSTGRTQPTLKLVVFFSNTRQIGFEVKLFHP